MQENTRALSDEITAVSDTIRLGVTKTGQGEGSQWWADVYYLAENILGPLGTAVIAEEDSADDTHEDYEAGLVAALVGVLDLLDQSHHVQLWRCHASLLSRLFLVMSEIIAQPAIRSEWVSLRVALVNSLTTTIQLIGNSL